MHTNKDLIIQERIAKRPSEKHFARGLFQLTQEEWENLKSQFATASWGGRRTPPYMFTDIVRFTCFAGVFGFNMSICKKYFP